MRIATTVLAALLVLSFQSAYSATAQQEKMKTCNADATSKQLKGDERKAFMKTCLSADSSGNSKQLNSQQQKMKDCNADAKTKGLAGADRKKFMSDCLKGATAPQ